ncbi:MAG: hypothetical protein ACXWCX_22025 [Burkholderiales bacterium]
MNPPFKSPLRREDERLLTGRARYVDNVHLDRMVHGVFIRSPMAHAEIVAIDASAALAAGALCVLILPHLANPPGSSFRNHKYPRGATASIIALGYAERGRISCAAATRGSDERLWYRFVRADPGPVCCDT